MEPTSSLHSLGSFVPRWLAERLTVAPDATVIMHLTQAPWLSTIPECRRPLPALPKACSMRVL
jgi:hypothetical protein